MTGDEMRSRRTRLGLTQTELGRQLGLSRVMVGLMERGVKEISLRTQTALAAVQPRPLDRSTSTFAPLTVRLEKALISAGLDYRADHMIEGQMVDFYLTDLDLALFVETSRWNAPARVLHGIDTIAVVGKSAVDAFATLIRYGGVHARMNAGRDAYAGSDYT